MVCGMWFYIPYASLSFCGVKLKRNFMDCKKPSIDIVILWILLISVVAFFVDVKRKVGDAAPIVCHVKVNILHSELK